MKEEQKKVELNSEKPLTEMFKELQQARIEHLENRKNNKLSTKILNATKNRKTTIKAKSSVNTYISSIKNCKINLKSRSINPFLLVLITMLIVIILFSTTYSITSFATATDAEVVTEYIEETPEFESNENSIDILKVLSSNVIASQKKEIVTEERDIEYKTIYIAKDTLKKDERIVVQPGKKGKEIVTAVKTFENDVFSEETIITRELIENYTEEIIELGTSEFLANYDIHIGDLLYVKETTPLKESMDDTSVTLLTINKSLDVKLLAFSDEWCKVDFEGTVGYVKKDVLTSAHIDPEIVNQSRINKAKSKLNIDMDLTKPSGLNLEDFKRILEKESKDVNKVFINNAEVFYKMEKKYNINGIFLMSVGIHESNWGASTISLDKKNLFGYGAYDNDPYNSSFTFETYEEGIELLSKVFVKYYLNEKGTKIYENEVAMASYYNGANVNGVNIRYATDPDWGSKVYSKMEYLYGKL